MHYFSLNMHQLCVYLGYENTVIVFYKCKNTNLVILITSQLSFDAMRTARIFTVIASLVCNIVGFYYRLTIYHTDFWVPTNTHNQTIEIWPNIYNSISLEFQWLFQIRCIFH